MSMKVNVFTGSGYQTLVSGSETDVHYAGARYRRYRDRRAYDEFAPQIGLRDTKCTSVKRDGSKVSIYLWGGNVKGWMVFYLKEDHIIIVAPENRGLKLVKNLRRNVPNGQLFVFGYYTGPETEYINRNSPFPHCYRDYPTIVVSTEPHQTNAQLFECSYMIEVPFAGGNSGNDELLAVAYENLVLR